MSISSMRSPRPASAASYQSSSPRLPSPLNPSLNSSSPPLSMGHATRNPPADEMSDTLSPLRERSDSGLTCSPRSSPGIARPRTSSFSHSPYSATSPERSPVNGPIPLQPSRTYSRHTSPSGDPFPQGIPFPSSSPLPLSPLAGLSQSPVSHDSPPLSPVSSGSRPGSPGSFHNLRPLCSPPHLTHSHFHPPQGSPVQNLPSSAPRFPRTQSLIQQSFGNSYATQVASSPLGDPRSRRGSLDAESRQHPFTRASPMPTGQLCIQDASTIVEGNSTPLNETPVRWWGGRGGWIDDWDNVTQQSLGTCDSNSIHFSSRGAHDGETGMTCMQTGCGNPLAFREPFGQGGGGPGAFLDEEIRASFDGARCVGASFADQSNASSVHVPMGIDPGYEMDGIPISRAMPMPIIPGVTGSRRRNDGPRYGELNVGSPPSEGTVMQKMPDDLARNQTLRMFGNPSRFMPDGMIHDGHGRENVGRNRRFSNASTHSSTSYTSCVSGPSRSQSHSLLMSSSHSHTSTCPSLSSLGIGIEEAEREERRSRTFWGRRNSGSTLKRQTKHSACGEGPDGEHTDDDNAMGRSITDSKQSLSHVHEKPAGKHGSFFFTRVGSKNGDKSHEQVHQAGYLRAEQCVSLAVTSILPATTITMLSPVGETLIKAKESVKYVGHELAPLVRDTLSMSTGVLSFVPLPGLEEAAKGLLTIWDACQKVDTNRLSCLRLVERCATLLYSVRCDVQETDMEDTLAEPVERLCGALAQIRTFLETQLHRPFLKRYVRREEIARELGACNDAITDAASRFGTSIQIRTFHEVCVAADESKRIAQEVQTILSMDHQTILRNCAIMYGLRPQATTELLNENALGLTMGAGFPTVNQHLNAVAGDGGGSDSGTHAHPAQLPQIAMDQSRNEQNSIRSGSERSTAMSPVLSLGNPSDLIGSTVSAPPTPTPTKATFAVRTKTTTETAIDTMTATTETRTAVAGTTATAITKSEKMALDAGMLLKVFNAVRRVQDNVDAAVDEAALRGTLVGALDARNDVEMVRCLQVARGEIPEAAETLRRMLVCGRTSQDGNNHAASEPEKRKVGNTDLDRKFMQNGIEAMMRLASAVKHQKGESGEGGDSASELPKWTVTRYEVIRTRKIGTGFFSDVYLGRWRELGVVVKVLAHSVSRAAFVRHIELWNALDHSNVLPLYGASSTVGEKPWFVVSKFCQGGNLAVSLQRARAEGPMVMDDKTTMRVDLLRFMHEIARGMAYLHESGVLHGELRAANVLVDGNGHCVLSDFGQCEIKSEVHRSCGQPEPAHRIRWKAPEMLTSNGISRLTKATDVYAFAVCCVEILGMGDLPWLTLDDRTVHDLVMGGERPPIPAFSGDSGAAIAVANLVQSCWVREPADRPSFSGIAVSLEEVWILYGHGSPQICRPSSPSIRTASKADMSTDSSPADEQYETASESMRTEVEEESVDGMIDVSLTSPAPALGKGASMFRITASNHLEIEKVTSGIPERGDNVTPMPSPTNKLDVDARKEANYRLVAGMNHAFHGSLTLPLWSPTRVELGAVGYLSKPKGEFITLFNAMDPLKSGDERLRQLPSMYGYGKFEAQKREEGKRSVAQRGLDAISVFLTFKTRGDRSYPERIAREYVFPLVHGKSSAYLCVEKTIHRYIDHLEAPMIWFKHHVDLILEASASCHAILKEDLILVTGTLDAPDWAVFVSDDHADGRAQFNVFANREKGEPWGMFTVESTVKHGNATWPNRCVDVGQGTFASKVSCVTMGSHDPLGDTVMLAGLRFGEGMQVPMVM